MSDLATRLSKLSPAQRRLLEERLAERKSIAEPIAIVGMGCRFPGAKDIDEFWKMIRDGVSSVSEVPPSRWDADAFYDPSGEASGKMSTKWGAFVDDVDQFDPVFFGISPREAARMDPQQRLLLEVAWETIEQAGISPKSMAGSKTGVFVGIGGTDYSKIPSHFENYLDQIDAHVGTGNALSIAANRISYIFDFRGPSFAVDTACSSALVALHCAVRSLRSGECDAALAGGVNLILSPEVTIAFSKARMLSPDGVCRPFDAEANGYVRGEGCGLVLIKRLSDAVKAGDHVLGVIRATAINQDGKTSGITAPNSDSQQQVILSALAEAGMSTEQVSYLEAHGTATPLGDPIETVALGKLFPRKTRDQRPCYMTSVKANIGHTETVSGMAGLMKTVLLMKHGVIPAQLHLNELNPNLSLSESRIQIPTSTIAWDGGDVRRVAGISSFGFGGTNTHVVVEEASASVRARPEAAELQPPRDGSTDDALQILTLSATNDSAIEMLAQRYNDCVAAQPETRLVDFCRSANAGRSHFSQRCAIVVDGLESLKQGLHLASQGEVSADVRRGTVRGGKPSRIAFLFTGQGSQYAGMGRELYAASGVFRRSLKQCDEILADRLDQSLLEVILNQNDPEGLLNETYYTQPALFALEYSIAQVWMSWGVRPSVVMGHSVGEYVAACIAGVFSLEDGLRLIAERGRLMQQLPREGGMAVVFAHVDRVRSHAAFAVSSLDVAAVNGPENTVVAGHAKDVECFVRAMESEGVPTQNLTVSHAFHSSMMEPILDDFHKVASEVDFQLPNIELVSNLSGKIETRVSGTPSNGRSAWSVATAEYWVRHIREAVQFSAGMTTLAESNPDLLIEVGPMPQLISMARRFTSIDDATWVPSMRKGQHDWRSMLDGLSSVYLAGCDIAWDQVGPKPRQRVDLPTYPFQRSRHWYEMDSAKRDFRGGYGPLLHPLLGHRVPVAMDKSLFQSSLCLDRPAFLKDHRVQGSVVLPAAAYVETALSAARQMFGEGHHSVEAVDILHAMFLDERQTYWLQTSLSTEQYGGCEFDCVSRTTSDASDSKWTIHAKGRIVRGIGDRTGVDLSAEVSETLQQIVDEKTRDEFYELVRHRELDYGESFRVLGDSKRSADAAIAPLVLCESVRKQLSQYHLHPAMLDACLQMAAQVVPLEEDGSYSPHTYMPTHIGALHVYRSPTESMQIFARRVEPATASPSPELVRANLYILDEMNRVIVELSDVEVRRLGKTRSGLSDDSVQWLYGVDWREDKSFGNDETSIVTHDSTPVFEGQWLILADEQGLGDAVAAKIEASGGQPVLLRQADVAESVANTLERLSESWTPQSIRGVVYLWSLDLQMPSAASSVSSTSERDDVRDFRTDGGCEALLTLLQKLARAGVSNLSTSLVSRHAHAVGVSGEVTNPVQAPMWGLGRVATLEHPELGIRLFDVDDESMSELASRLVREFAAPSEEAQIAYRDGKRYLARLIKTPEQGASSVAQQSAELRVPTDGPSRLTLSSAGSIDSLQLSTMSRQAPAEDQIEIAVHATGLNFSDVLKALGLYPGITDDIVPMGIECSGVVTSVGSQVNRFQVGDAVVGVVPYGFATHALTREFAIVHKPAFLSHDEAATVPIAFMTAHHALHHLAQLQPGERVLIHAGAGGVGLAAIQIAQSIGAEVFATAGSEAKRDFLRSLGVSHVMNSRTLEFADQIREITDGEGVDVVLNSLPGEAIDRSLAVLRAFGRFLEIGKTDIYQNRMVGLSPFQDNLSYFAIDLDRMLRQRPEAIRKLFGEVVSGFESGDYQPLPMTTFAYRETRDAFRHMAQRKNIGKVVVAIDRVSEGRRESASERPGTYLITGGLGALGMQVAKSLAERGIDHVALLSRRIPNDSQHQRIQGLQENGLSVCVLQGDVADRASLKDALRQIPHDFPQLQGIVHAAGVLDDGVLFEMDADKLEHAMRPKVAGTWNLHQATLEYPIEEFVLFSSIASLLGSPGQANYAAGNAFLDSFSSYRRSHRLPATTINWGPWADGGMATENDRASQLNARGMDLLPASESLDLMNRMVDQDVDQMAVMRPNWSDLLKSYRGSIPSLLKEMHAEVDSGADSTATGDGVDQAFRRELTSANESDRQRLLRSYFKQQLAVIMGLRDSSLDEEQPLNTMGLDSLMAIELKNQVETRLGVVLPMARFMDGPSVTSLATVVAELVVAEQEVASLADQGIEDRDRFPLSYGQQSLWFLHQLAPESSAYHICDAVRVRGPLQLDVLQKTTQFIVDRHAAFRTTFHDENGRPYQRVHAAWPVHVKTVDAGQWSQQQIDAAVNSDLNQPFDLEQGPLLRVTVFALDEQTNVLLFCVHHIVADFWSLVACTQEFMEIYSTLRAGQQPQLPIPSIDYGRFVQWQQEMLESEEGKQHWSYWKDQLAGELPVLELPTDRPRPQVQTFQGNLAFRWLDPALTTSLRELAEEQGATLNMLLLAAYQLLLHRYSGQNDILVGLPTSGRARAEFSPLVGYFVNPVPIRGDLSGNPIFLEFLDQIRGRTLGALEHQDYPLSLLVDRLNPERDSSRSAMFQAAFVMQKAQVLHEQGLTPFLMGQSGATLDVADLVFESLTLDQWVAQLDVSMAASEANGGTSLGLQYNSDLFDDATAEKMLEHFEAILRDVAAEPNQRLSEVELLTSVERRALQRWNQTSVQPKTRELIHQRIERQAKRTPHGLAIICGESHLSYQQLDERANQLAHYIRSLGAKRNERVGLCLDRDENLIVAMQAILRSGAAYVPLDPTYPAQRLNEIASSAGMSLVVTASEHLGSVSGFQGVTVCLDRDYEAIEAQSSDSLESNASPDDLIYVIYTSGSTGKPKGAGVYHRGFNNLMDWYVEDLGIDAEDRTLVITSHGFDLTQKNLYANLMTGGQLHLSTDRVYDPSKIRSEIDAGKITLLNCTPSHIYGVADASSEELARLDSLRMVILGGEPIDLAKLERWFRQDGFHAEIVNSYGPTECTDVVVFHRMSDPLLHLGEQVPLGRPIRNVQFAILDENLGVVPPGAVGELCLGGECVGAGYIDDAELTSRRFVQNAPGDSDGVPPLIYRTGDLCRVREDGVLEFLGRRDHQIKLRGFRIELGEIEQTLSAHEAVHEVVVVVREDAPDVRQLVAYVVADELATTSELIDFAKQTLPTHMVPAACIRLAKIPLTPHGKLDRRSLPSPGWEMLEDREYTAPASNAEKAVAEIWQDLLNQRRVGVHDNFFELGGDSLLSIEVVSRLGRVGWTCSPAQIFQHQSLQDLASVLIESAVEPSGQMPVSGEVALSPIQHWFFELGLRQPSHFNQSVLLEVPAGLRRDSLQKSLDSLVAHHDGLRSNFRLSESGWVQEIGAVTSTNAIEFVDLSELNESQQTFEIERQCERAQASMDLESGQVMRVLHFELGKNRPARLLLTAHHLIVDPYSWRVVLDDLRTAYQQALGSQTIQLPPKTTSVQVWNERQRQLAQRIATEAELSAWHSGLSEFKPKKLRVDTLEGQNTFGSAETIEVSLSVSETDAFQRCSSAAADESIVYLVTALSRAMYEWGNDDVLVDLERHGRETIEEGVDATRTVGWFVAMHPFATHFDSNVTLSQNLQRMRERLKAVPGHGESYGLLRYLHESAEIREAIADHERVDVRLNYLGRMEQDRQPSTFQLAPERSGNHQPVESIRPHLLEIDARIREGKLLVEWTYSPNCHLPASMEHLTRLWLESLRDLLGESCR